MNVTQSADKLSDADYGFKVGIDARDADLRSALRAHRASQFGTCAAVKGVPNPVQGQQLEQALKTKAEFAKALADSFAFCDDAFASLTDAERARDDHAGRRARSRAPRPSPNIVSHNNEMYGTSAAYLRSKGIVPPSTERASDGTRRRAPDGGRGDRARRSRTSRQDVRRLHVGRLESGAASQARPLLIAMPSDRSTAATSKPPAAAGRAVRGARSSSSTRSR